MNKVHSVQVDDVVLESQESGKIRAWSIEELLPSPDGEGPKALMVCGLDENQILSIVRLGDLSYLDTQGNPDGTCWHTWTLVS